MKSLLLIIFSFFLLTAFNDKSSLTSSKDLTCTLTSDKTIYKIGELPKLKVEISNNTKRDIYLIGSLDGSDVKWRFPHCYYSIDKPKPDTLRLARCGNMNPLRLEDFKLIRVGQKFNPYESFDNYGFFEDYTVNNAETFKNPGVYKIKFCYSTKSEKFSDFIGDRGFNNKKSDSLQFFTLFKLVPKADIVSNEIELRFEE